MRRPSAVQSVASTIDALYRAKGFEFGVPAPLDLAGAVDELATLPLLFQPGSAWAYSMALDVLGRLEKEAFGQVRTRVPREAVVRVASPIRLEERYDMYRQNKRQVVADVTGEMEDAIRGMLQELSRESTPIQLDA